MGLRINSIRSAITLNRRNIPLSAIGCRADFNEVPIPVRGHATQFRGSGVDILLSRRARFFRCWLGGFPAITSKCLHRSTMRLLSALDDSGIGGDQDIDLKFDGRVPSDTGL
jgi:hypothetical protein